MTILATLSGRVPLPIHFEVQTDSHYLIQKLVISPLREMTIDEKKDFDSFCQEMEKLVYQDILRLDWRLKA